ncbi:Adaptive-response sensory-kinase SasA [bioreactor metagenome]|uniref:histidine kinase n=1 Tax=bioreactor metagenome TaxID=1076179 RepID=A0A644X2Q6_9ZZZZ
MKLTDNFAAKVSAVILLVLAAVVTAGSTLATAFLYYNGLYDIQRGIFVYTYIGPWASLLRFIYEGRYVLIFCAAAGAIFCVADLIFLLCSAGHRRGKEGITLNLQDKIPLDLYLFAVGFAVVGLVNIVGSVNWNYEWYDAFLMIVCALVLVLAGLLMLAAVMTLATRVKAGNMWRNTLLYRLFQLCRRYTRKVWSGLSEFIQAIPLIWRTPLIFCAVTAINVILAVFAFSNGSGGAFLLGFLFNLFLLAVCCRTAIDLHKLKKAGEMLAAGDFEYKVAVKNMFLDLRKHAEHLNAIGDGMAIALEQKMKSERLKTELITNVSHDLKTPLTSIVNYVDLMKKEGLTGTAAEYLTVLDRQSQRLKKLTEDLVEASKASTGNIPLNLTRTDVVELVNQAVGEYNERLSASKLEPVISAPQEEVFVRADGRLIWRVLDNLLSNACKYALTGTRLYIDVVPEPTEVVISMKNISREKLNINADELMERFVRGESSRTTEGSGLGLNIARSLTELQRGNFRLLVDGDLFKAEITFPRLI